MAEILTDGVVWTDTDPSTIVEVVIHGHVRPDQKRRPRIVDRLATTCHVLGNPECVVCGDRGATGHHVVAKGSPHFGDDIDANIVTVCGSGTTGCHGAVERHETWACLAVGEHIRDHRPDTIAYIADRLGSVDAMIEFMYRRYDTRIGGQR